MKPHYTDVLATPKAQAVPVAQAALTARLLSCGAAELTQVIDEFVLSNPMVEPPSGGAGRFFPEAASQAAPESLGEHLSSQLRVAVRDPGLLRVCLLLVHSLDRNGYLREPEEDLCLLAQCGRPMLADALRQVQLLDPAGVGARSLSECLCLQLEARQPVDELALTICRSHLDALAEGRLALPGRTREELDRAAALIRSLDPRPGSSFDHEAVPWLIPDILIRREDSRLEVSLVNQPPLPFLDPQYLGLSRVCGEEDRQYIQKQLAQARSFLFALRQRSSTLLTVASHAVQVQTDSLLTAAPRLTLTLTDTAQALSLSVSTVSRAVKDKYVQYGSRVFPLRALFPSGGTQALSRPQIIRQIQLLCGEHGEALSDQAVCVLLAGQGVSIARRTVNKYRRLMREEACRP